MEEKKRIWVSRPMKVLVVTVSLLSLFASVFCGAFLMDLLERGVPLKSAYVPFADTEMCASRMADRFAYVLYLYGPQEAGQIWEEDGVYLLDLAKSGGDTLGLGGEDTTYRLESLAKLNTDELEEILGRASMYSANDVGVKDYNSTAVVKELEEKYGYLPDIWEAVENEGCPYMMDGVVFETTGSETNRWEPSETTIEALQALGCDPALYSSRFLYLYEFGKSMESDCLPESGRYLCDYAALQYKKISLEDLYTMLLRWKTDADEWVYVLPELNASSNLLYCIETETGNVYTNVDDWRKGYEEAKRALEQSSLITVTEKTKTEQAKANQAAANALAGIAYEKNNSYVKVKASAGSSTLTEMLSSRVSHVRLSSVDKAVVALDTNYPVSDSFADFHKMTRQWGGWTVPLLAGAAAGLVVWLLSVLLLTTQAGGSSRREGVCLNWYDRMPTEIYLAVTGMAVTGIGSMAIVLLGEGVWPNYPIWYRGSSMEENIVQELAPLRLLATAAIVTIAYILCLLFYTSLVRRIKAKNLWERSLIRSIFRMCKEVYEARKSSQKFLLLFAAFALLQICLPLAFDGFGILLAVIMDIFVALYFLRDFAGRQTVRGGLRRMAQGELTYKIDLEELHGDNLEMAKTVNRMGEGLQIALQEQMKSERLKADLITNVSHDIKTPLTSIINYVDLLKREDIPNEKAQGYIQILDAKSQRLKQLTDDLVEASKISSGNIRLEFMKLNLNELVYQVNGEFDERFADRGLTLVCHTAEKPLVIYADSRRIWRVLENLYVNVVKYAMPGTRVYVDTYEENGRIFFSIKNISENPLNINADELTERFIRGDVSRSTEGSGLGLSIAKNLTQIQKGIFEIHLDGDLFKVLVIFENASEATTSGARTERKRAAEGNLSDGENQSRRNPNAGDQNRENLSEGNPSRVIPNADDLNRESLREGDSSRENPNTGNLNRQWSLRTLNRRLYAEEDDQDAELFYQQQKKQERKKRKGRTIRRLRRKLREYLDAKEEEDFIWERADKE